MDKEEKGEKEFNISDIIGGKLNIFGLNIDLGKLLAAPEEVKDQLEELREKLKQAGGKEVLSDEEWRRGGVSVSGHLRTSGLLGDSEYHIGTTPRQRQRPEPKARAPETPEVVEPAVDVFQEEEEVVVVAEVPGVGLEDLEVAVEGNVLSLSTKEGVRRQYKKVIELGSPVAGESLQATCRNGILEIHLKKPPTE
ncbi:MAG: Hsp20/alpha crystallin family protein [Candidatus Binatia bacterium]